MQSDINFNDSQKESTKKPTNISYIEKGIYVRFPITNKDTGETIQAAGKVGDYSAGEIIQCLIISDYDPKIRPENFLENYEKGNYKYTYSIDYDKVVEAPDLTIKSLFNSWYMDPEYDFEDYFKEEKYKPYEKEYLEKVVNAKKKWDLGHYNQFEYSKFPEYYKIMLQNPGLLNGYDYNNNQTFQLAPIPFAEKCRKFAIAAIRVLYLRDNDSLPELLDKEEK